MRRYHQARDEELKKNLMEINAKIQKAFDHVHNEMHRLFKSDKLDDLFQSAEFWITKFEEFNYQDERDPENTWELDKSIQTAKFQFSEFLKGKGHENYKYRMQKKFEVQINDIMNSHRTKIENQHNCYLNKDKKLIEIQESLLKKLMSSVQDLETNLKDSDIQEEVFAGIFEEKLKIIRSTNPKMEVDEIFETAWNTTFSWAKDDHYELHHFALQLQLHQFKNCNVEQRGAWKKFFNKASLGLLFPENKHKYETRNDESERILEQTILQWLEMLQGRSDGSTEISINNAINEFGKIIFNNDLRIDTVKRRLLAIEWKELLKAVIRYKYLNLSPLQVKC